MPIARRIEAITDKKIVITPNIAHHSSEEQELRLLKEWIRSFEAFVSNHRDMANCYYSIDLELTKEEVCSICHRPWEVMRDDAGYCCANCGEVTDGQ